MKELLQEIYTKFNSPNMNLYLNEAPANIDMPYCVFFLITHNVNELTFEDNINNYTIQFSIFADSATKALDLSEEIFDLYESCILPVTATKFVSMNLESSNLFKDNNTWHRVMDFYIETTTHKN